MKLLRNHLRSFGDSLNKTLKVFNVLVIVVAVYVAIMIIFSNVVFGNQAIKIDMSEEGFEKQTAVLYELLSIEDGENEVSALNKYFGQVFTCIAVGEVCDQNQDSPLNNPDNSVLGMMTNGMSAIMINPPASSIAWLSEGFSEAGFIPDTHAAGVGFYSIGIFSDLWQLFRDISYFLIVLFIVTVGFLIMFRVQVSPQTVVSMENALPRIIFTLLAITFSFPIVGLLVDFVYISLLVIFNIFGTLQPVILADKSWLSADTLTWQYLGFTGFDNNNPFDQILGWRYLEIYSQAIRGLWDIIPAWLRGVGVSIITIIAAMMARGLAESINKSTGEIEGEANIPLLASIKIVFGAFFSQAASIPLTFIIVSVLLHAVPFLLGIIVLLILFFRILFFLITAYVQIIVDLIFAPIFILPTVLPGNNSFVDWLKRVAGNLAVFPITVILLILVQYMAYIDPETNFLGIASQTQFTLPGLNYLATSTLAPIISGSLLFLIPTLAGQVKESIGGKPSIEAGPGVLFGGAVGGIGAIVGQYAGIATFARQMGNDSPLGRMFGWLPGVNSTGSPGRRSDPSKFPGTDSGGSGS